MGKKVFKMGAHAQTHLFWGYQLPNDVRGCLIDRQRPYMCRKCRATFEEGKQPNFCPNDGAEVIRRKDALDPDALYGELPHGQAHGCQFVQVNSILFVVVMASHVSSATQDTEVQKLSSDFLIANVKWFDQIREFCLSLGIVPTGVPQWHLVSYLSY